MCICNDLFYFLKDREDDIILKDNNRTLAYLRKKQENSKIPRYWFYRSSVNLTSV